MIEYIENRTFDEIEIGDTANISHTLTTKDIQIFAIISGDVNPAHVDAEYAKSDLFHKVISHGMLTGAMFSTVLGTELPGPGTIYLEQAFRFVRPVTIGDRITAQVTVISKDDKKKHIQLNCVGTNQAGKEVITGTATVIAPTEKVRRKRIILPEVKLIQKECPKHHQIICMAEGLAPIKTAVVHPVDKLSLEGALAAKDAKLIIPILIGPEDRIRAVAEQENFDLSGIEIISTQHSHAAAERAVELARQGKVDAIMKGCIHTDELLHPALDKEHGLRTERRFSHVSAVDTPAYPRILFITDAAVNIAPKLSEKRDIVQNAIDLFREIGFGVPKVAILSAVETVTEKIPSTLDATALCKMAERGQIIGGILDGPLAFDNALSIEAARVKGIHSEVAGQADILVVPDIEVGNVLLKQMTLLTKATMAGIVLGAQVPIILTSRSSSIFSRQASCALALLYKRDHHEEQ